MADRFLGYHDNDSTIDVVVGDLVIVALPENATTGYQWAVASHSPTIVALDDTDRTTSASDVPGAGVTTAVFRFRAIAPGKAAIALKYWRGYETDDASTAYRLRVGVTGADEKDRR